MIGERTLRSISFRSHSGFLHGTIVLLRNPPLSLHYISLHIHSLLVRLTPSVVINARKPSDLWQSQIAKSQAALSLHSQRLAEVRNEKPMPLDVGGDRQGHPPFHPSPQPHYRPSVLRWAQSGRFGRWWLMWVLVCRLCPLASSRNLGVSSGGVVLLRLQKVVRKPEIPLQSAETSALLGTWSGF